MRNGRRAAVPALIGAILFAGCGGHGIETPVPTPAPDYVAAGWTAFESGAPQSAAALFRLALVTPDDSIAMDASTGLGWSLLELGRPDSALVAFEANGSAARPSIDLIAGRSFAAHDATAPAYDFAISSAESTLAREPRYSFAHDPTIDWWDLRLVMAQSHFAVGDWLGAAADADSLGGESLDPASATFISDLLLEIQRLSLSGASPGSTPTL